MFNRQIMSLAVWAVTLLLMLASAADAKRRKPRNVFDLEEDFGWASTSLSFPMVKEGTAFRHWVSTGWQPWKHWNMVLGWSYLDTPVDGFMVGNLRFWTGTGYGSKIEEGLGAWIDFDLDAGISPVGWGGEHRQRAAALSWAMANNWLTASPGAYALEADLSAGVFLNQTSFVIGLHPQIVRPYTETAEHVTRTGLAYVGGLGFGYGDHRGAFSIYLGCYGFKEFTGEAQNAFGLLASARVKIGSLGIRPYFSVGIPVLGYGPQLIADISTGISWRFDLRAKKEDKLDPLPPSPSSAFAPLRR